jgi:hypothetical protein
VHGERDVGRDGGLVAGEDLARQVAEAGGGLDVLVEADEDPAWLDAAVGAGLVGLDADGIAGEDGAAAAFADDEHLRPRGRPGAARMRMPGATLVSPSSGTAADSGLRSTRNSCAYLNGRSCTHSGSAA